MNKNIQEKLLNRIIIDKNTNCWIWQGAKNQHGYGNININGKVQRTHRVSFQFHSGITIPHGFVVSHYCDNPSCINPDHLFMSTQKGNMLDMRNKSRQAKGENNGSAKLTEKEVRIIRRAYETGQKTQLDLAQLFNVSPQLISSITRNKLWRNIEHKKNNNIEA